MADVNVNSVASSGPAGSGGDDDLCGLSATVIARRIAQGVISARQAVEAHIARIEQVNPKLNAVVVKRYEAALAEADAIDRRRARGETLPRLAGVPITVKECLDLAGTASTFGLAARTARLAAEDDPYVARLRCAGAIVVGKTNVSQLLMFTETDNPVYGRTNNPWKAERSSGGSSGGEAAIIAASASPLGLGTDIGGSLRIPATSCGIAAIRPTAGRTPDLGRASIPIGQRGIVSQIGPMARCVDDLALALDIINGGHGLDTMPQVPLGDPAGVDVSTLRIALTVDDDMLSVSAAVRRAVGEAADMLRAAGARVVPWQIPSGAEAFGIWLRCVTADRGCGMRRLLGGEKADPRLALLLRLAGLPPVLRGSVAALMRIMGQKYVAASIGVVTAGDTDSYWQAIEAKMDYQARFRRALDECVGGPADLVLMPAFGVPAVRHGASANMPVAGSYSILSPVLGYPAGVVPVTCVLDGEDSGRRKAVDAVEKTAFDTDRDSVGLPVGVQLMGRPWRDDVVLAALRVIEQAVKSRGGFPGHPPL